MDSLADLTAGLLQPLGTTRGLLAFVCSLAGVALVIAASFVRMQALGPRLRGDDKTGGALSA